MTRRVTCFWTCSRRSSRQCSAPYGPTGASHNLSIQQAADQASPSRNRHGVHLSAVRRLLDSSCLRELPPPSVAPCLRPAWTAFLRHVGLLTHIEMLHHDTLNLDPQLCTLGPGDQVRPNLKSRLQWRGLVTCLTLCTRPSFPCLTSGCMLWCVYPPQVHVMDEGRRCVVGQAAHGLSLVASQVLRPGKVHT